MESIKLLSLVVPTYGQEKTIVKNIKHLDDALSKLPCKYELIVVVDGIVDGTIEKLKKIRNKNLKVLHYEKNHGKGHALRLGMLKAKGDIVGFIDGGMDIKCSSIALLLELMVFHNADIMVGSKLHPESNVNYPVFRKILSWGYRSFVFILFGFDLKDTQVGLKFFKRKVVRKIFPLLLVKKFAFDIETIAVSHSFGFNKIHEGPIRLHFRDGSINNLNFLRVVFFMIWDTAAVFYRINFLKYYQNMYQKRNESKVKFMRINPL